MYFSADLTVDQINEDERSKQIMDSVLPGVRQMLMNQPMAKDLSIRNVAKYAQDMISQKDLDVLDIELKKLNTGENIFTEREKSLVKFVHECMEKMKESCASSKEEMKDAIYPGKVWLDTNGKPIQAHGGAALYDNGKYYWYGENKEFTDGKNGIWTFGIRAYESTDLCNWEDKGLIVEPDLDHPDHSLFPSASVDRPHIIKCEHTGKYVCWIKISGNSSYFVILQADTVLGPYEIVQDHYYPGDRDIGDFDIVVSEDQKGYLYVEESHNRITGYQLSDDFTVAKEQVSLQYADLNPPFCREGVAVFERKGKKYMFTSGMTGYLPNESDCAIADDWDAEFISIGNPCVGDDTNTTFNSQISKVFQVAGKEDFYVAMGDRWLSDTLLDARLSDIIRRSTAAYIEPEKYTISQEEGELLKDLPQISETNTSKARYVWLPIRFVDDKPVIEWKEEWSI